MRELAQVSWRADDVRCLPGCEDWTDERCEDFLERNEDHLQSAMIELGWSVLRTLLICEDNDE